MSGQELSSNSNYISAIAVIVLGIIGLGFGYLLVRYVRTNDESIRELFDSIKELFRRRDEDAREISKLKNDIEWIKKEHEKNHR